MSTEKEKVNLTRMAETFTEIAGAIPSRLRGTMPETDLHKPGVKESGKPPVGSMLQRFSLALEAMAKVDKFGGEKYVPGGWQTVPNGVDEYTEAMARHFVREGREVFDEDGQFHMAQTAWNAVVRLELFLRKQQEK